MGMAQARTDLQQFLQELVEQMVARPDRVDIVMGELRGCVTYDVRVAPGDVGRLIGRGGRTARSIHTIVGTVAAIKGVRFELNLPQSGEAGRG